MIDNYNLLTPVKAQQRHGQNRTDQTNAGNKSE